jgi:hypothetical protein
MSWKKEGGRGLPVRCVIHGACAARAARIAAQQIGRHARFVDEDTPLRVVKRLRLAPAAPLSPDVGAPLLAGVYRFL